MYGANVEDNNKYVWIQAPVIVKILHRKLMEHKLITETYYVLIK